MKNIFCKLTAFILIAMSVISLTACSNNNSNPETTTAPATEPTTINVQDINFDITKIHSYKENSNDNFSGAWKITGGDGNQFGNFTYIFNGEGKAVLTIDNTGYCGTYSIERDDETEELIFNCQMMFGINGSYYYNISKDGNKINLRHTETLKNTVIEKVDEFSMLPELKKDATIDKKLVGIWQSDLGEFYYFGEDGLLYHNQYGTMFNYATYTATKGKINSEYKMSEVTKETLEYSIDNDVLIIDEIEYKKSKSSDLMEFISQ